MRIRDATVDDLDAMRRAKVLAGHAAWAHFLPRHVLDSFGFPERWADAVQSSEPRASALVGVVDDEVVGFALTRASKDEDATPWVGELDGFYVLPSAWGQGVGRGLLGEATRRLLEAGFMEATLWTARENDRPRRIYERAGWLLDGAARHREASGVAYTELRFRRPLGRDSTD